ncbi:hypothetical protein ACH5RR_012871 [Cinchona calisaya]|uniref:Uncharacterized protein n=1 Tax=Cinchona calisaya TaxID=153742 RepID=A0ABD3A8T8_9GENT
MSVYKDYELGSNWKVHPISDGKCETRKKGGEKREIEKMTQEREKLGEMGDGWRDLKEGSRGRRRPGKRKR